MMSFINVLGSFLVIFLAGGAFLVSYILRMIWKKLDSHKFLLINNRDFGDKQLELLRMKFHLLEKSFIEVTRNVERTRVQPGAQGALRNRTSRVLGYCKFHRMYRSQAFRCEGRGCTFPK